MSSVQDPHKTIYRAALVILLILQVGTMLFFGARKCGMHEDEYYSYYSSNRTSGFFYPDRTWVETAEIKKEFMVLPGEEFRFDTVKMVQSWDVHPPLYYQILHTVCSLTPGVFSKWQGIAVNLIAFVLGQAALYLLAVRLAGLFAAGSKGSIERRLVGILAVAVWGWSPAAASMVMFIRMYTWLTLFVMLSALFHIRLIERKSKPAQNVFDLVLVSLVTLAGFLTHYYFAVFLFFAGISVVLLLWIRQDTKTIWGYIAGQGAALVLGVLYYPAAVSHILRGYRGKEAQTAFFQLDNLLSRWQYFAGLADKMALGDLSSDLFVFIIIAAAVCTLLALIAAAIRCFISEKRNTVGSSSPDLVSGISGIAEFFRRPPIAAFAFLLVTCGGYFGVVSKTALLLGDSSIRYILPVCPILIMILILVLYAAVVRVQEKLSEGESAGGARRSLASGTAAIFICVMVLLLIRNAEGLFLGRVLFLYPEDAEKIAYAKSNRDVPTAVAFDPVAPFNMWFLTDELLERDRIFLIDLSNPEAVNGEFTGEASSILIYAAENSGRPAMLEDLQGAEENGSAQVQIIDTEAMWTLYRIDFGN